MVRTILRLFKKEKIKLANYRQIFDIIGKNFLPIGLIILGYFFALNLNFVKSIFGEVGLFLSVLLIFIIIFVSALFVGGIVGDTFVILFGIFVDLIKEIVSKPGPKRFSIKIKLVEGTLVAGFFIVFVIFIFAILFQTLAWSSENGLSYSETKEFIKSDLGTLPEYFYFSAVTFFNSDDGYITASGWGKWLAIFESFTSAMVLAIIFGLIIAASEKALKWVPKRENKIVKK